MKVGYLLFEDEDLLDYEVVFVEEAAILFAENEHEIVEACDMTFDLMVIDDSGNRHELHMVTEFHPSYSVERQKQTTGTLPL